MYDWNRVDLNLGVRGDAHIWEWDNVGAHFSTEIRKYKNMDPYSVFYHATIRIIFCIMVN